MGMLNEIAAKLEALGCGTVPATIRIDGLPASPDACCCVNGTGGSSPDMTMGSTAISVEHPGIQLLFRGEADDTEAPRALAEIAYAGLAAVQAVTLSAGSGGTSAFYHAIRPTQKPFLLQRDVDGRCVIAFNCMVEKEPSA